MPKKGASNAVKYTTKMCLSSHTVSGVGGGIVKCQLSKGHAGKHGGKFKGYLMRW